MMMPTTRASSMIGPPSLSETTMASRPMSMASFGVTAIPPRRGSDRHAPDVLLRLDDAGAHRRHRQQLDQRVDVRPHHVAVLAGGGVGGIVMALKIAARGGDRAGLDHLHAGGLIEDALESDDLAAIGLGARNRAGRFRIGEILRDDL